MGNLPAENDVVEFLREFAERTNHTKFPLWTVEDIVSEGWLLWANVRAKYNDKVDSRWRGLLTVVMQRRLPEIYQKSLGKKCRRGKDHSRKYFTDAQLHDRPRQLQPITEIGNEWIFSLAKGVIQGLFLVNLLRHFDGED
tara:strand:+ start:1686 stop:2105 length:420 start_codon:yes stop_codon:yes gene_type:complete